MSSHNPGLRNTCKTILLYSHEGKKSRYEDSATVRREKKRGGGRDPDDATCIRVRYLYNGIPVTVERVNKVAVTART